MAREKPNTGEHIDDIVNRTTCEKHKVPKGVPCFHIHYDTAEKYGPAVCGPRITKAGFNGSIQPSSLSRKSKDSGSRPRR